MQVGDIMHGDVVTVGATESFAAAARVMREHRISSVIVQGERGPAGCELRHRHRSFSRFHARRARNRGC